MPSRSVPSARIFSRMSTGAWGAIAERERILTLDVLRGVAIFGVLLANIFIFAFPAGSPSLVAEGSSAADQSIGLFLGLFVQGKFYTVLSLLFGAGIALQSRRAARLSRPATGMYVRRLILLALIGIVHAVFFFAADILLFYAIIAFLALPWRRAEPKTLLVAAVALYAVGLVVMAAYAYRSGEHVSPQEPDWRELAEASRSTAQPTRGGVFPMMAGLLRFSELEFYEFMADERRIFAEGTCLDMAKHRAVRSLMFGLPLRLAFLSWTVLALFLVGMYLVMRSLITDVSRNTSEYGRAANSLFVVGMILQLVGGAAQLKAGAYFWAVPVYLVGTFAGIVVVSLAYAAWLVVLCARRPDSHVVRALAAVGRLALTNYVGQSVICGAIFYGHGLGLIGQLRAVQVMMLVLPVFGIQVAFSALWLRYFRLGPVEWIWRTLSYWRIQPLLRRAQVA
jgi:uncharacterized protein